MLVHAIIFHYCEYFMTKYNIAAMPDSIEGLVQLSLAKGNDNQLLFPLIFDDHYNSLTVMSIHHLDAFIEWAICNFSWIKNVLSIQRVSYTHSHYITLDDTWCGAIWLQYGNELHEKFTELYKENIVQL